MIMFINGIEYRPCIHSATGDIIPGYWVNENAEVYSEKSGKHIKAHISGNTEYLRYVMHHKGKQYNVDAHRLVALAFIEKPSPICPKGFPEEDWERLSEKGRQFLDQRNMQVDHIDGDKNNNHRSNLRWLTGEANRAIAMSQKRKEVDLSQRVPSLDEWL